MCTGLWDSCGAGSDGASLQECPDSVCGSQLVQVVTYCVVRHGGRALRWTSVGKSTFSLSLDEGEKSSSDGDTNYNTGLHGDGGGNVCFQKGGRSQFVRRQAGAVVRSQCGW